MVTFKKINLKTPPTMREEVLRQVRQKILTGKAAPGTRLSETYLAKELGTSRTPVREALHILETEKIIESLPRIGYIVRGIEQEEVEEIIEIRIALETLAAKLASKKISLRVLEQLKNIILQAEISIEKKDTQRVIDLDTKFHDTICQASKSQRIQEMSQMLRDHMLRFRMMGLCVDEIARRSNEGHRRIANAIESKNIKEIESAVRYHLNVTRKDLIQIIQ